MAKEYLSQKKVAFTNYDVSKDREKTQEMVKKSGQLGVPVIMVDEKLMVGFNQVELDKLLAG
jgi:glutaredoxin